MLDRKKSVRADARVNVDMNLHKWSVVKKIARADARVDYVYNTYIHINFHNWSIVKQIARADARVSWVYNTYRRYLKTH